MAKMTEPAIRREMEITRLFNAPRSLVFRAWTKAEHLRRWWAPKDFTTPYCEADFRVGGAFRYCMRSPEGQDFWGKGVYKEIIEPEKIVLADTFTDEQGNPVPPSYYGMASDSPAESLITVTFEEQEGKTKLVLNFTSMTTSEKEMEGADQGWNDMFDRLEEVLQQA